MIKATIQIGNKKVVHTFNTKRVRDVWVSCAKHLGKPYRNIQKGNKVVWRFEDGTVTLDGYNWFGSRTDFARLSRERL